LRAGETLLVIEVYSARDGTVTIQTVWAISADVTDGHRRTDIETVAGEASLQRRLAELAHTMLGSDALPAAA
jgi:hypothetical protein